MHLPTAVHFPSTHASSPMQSPLSLHRRVSQQPDSPQTFPSRQLSAVQRAMQPATQRTSVGAHRLAAAGSFTSGSRHTSPLPQSESRKHLPCRQDVNAKRNPRMRTLPTARHPTVSGALQRRADRYNRAAVFKGITND